MRGQTGSIVNRGRHALAFQGQAGHREESLPDFSYRAEFDRAALWNDATDKGTVTVDLSDSYLEPVTEWT